MLDKILNSTATDAKAFAISLMLISLVMLSAQDAMVKLVSSSTSLWQFQVYRALLNLVYLCALAWWYLRQQSLQIHSVPALVCRALFHVGALTFFFAGAPFLSLATMAGGLYTFPVFVVVLSYLVLGEKVGRWRVLAIICGFVGTMLVIKPGDEAFRLAALLPVCAGFCYGCFVITTRRFCRLENPIVMVIASNLMIVLIGLIGWVVVLRAPFSDAVRIEYAFLLAPQWSIAAWVFGLILLCAILNTTANLCIGKAYQSADSSFLAPVDYSYLIFAGFWGWVFWNDIPSAITVAGMFLIASAGILVAWREHIDQR